MIALLVGLAWAAPDVFGDDSGQEPSAPTGPTAGPMGAMPPELIEAAMAAKDLPLAARLEAVSTPIWPLWYKLWCAMPCTITLNVKSRPFTVCASCASVHPLTM